MQALSSHVSLPSTSIILSSCVVDTMYSSEMSVHFSARWWYQHQNILSLSSSVSLKCFFWNLALSDMMISIAWCHATSSGQTIFNREPSTHIWIYGVILAIAEGDQCIHNTEWKAEHFSVMHIIFHIHIKSKHVSRFCIIHHHIIPYILGFPFMNTQNWTFPKSHISPHLLICSLGVYEICEELP